MLEQVNHMLKCCRDLQSSVGFVDNNSEGLISPCPLFTVTVQ